ncbi:hypothetical protein QBC35DRAFT_504018 [Podospora australis]|uniref:Diphthine methyltransferase n=1 Tax=Podospora australis TaxID=1536484 RepID=A0AAN6WPU6_9PEZI|nr:hypothetical protein QBC35DRAFT_504018 [Podospora australis]
MDESAGLVQSIWSRELNLPPSCIEFCPAHPSYFLVGTYNLEKDNFEPTNDERNDDTEASQIAQPKRTQSRNGSILVFRVDGGEIMHVQTQVQSSALLDLHFNPNIGYQDICATVSSTAILALFKLVPDTGEKQPLKHLNTLGISALSEGEITPSEGAEILFLSLCWHPSRADMLALTTSTGHVYLVHLSSMDNGWKLHSEPVIIHTLEAWTVTLAPNVGFPGLSDEPKAPGEVTFRVFSGGDDSKLRFGTFNWDATDGQLTETLPAVEFRGHDAGVTAILPLFVDDNGVELFITGSYDENIRLFSLAPYGRPKNLAEKGLGGGVWRLKLINLIKDPSGDLVWKATILASCMHAGARVVEVFQTKVGEFGVSVKGRFEEHKSMNYGSDFVPGGKDKLTIVSTSFYDRLLCLWELKLP